MSSAATESFEKWLCKELRTIGADENVLLSYLVGILEGDEPEEEKLDALEGILAGLLPDGADKLATDFIEKWNELHAKDKEPAKSKEITDVETQLAKLLDGQKLATTKQRNYTEEEKRIKDQILAQYSQVEFEEDDEYMDSGDEKTDLSRNTNALDVANAAKERREQAKLDSQRKKDKDKEDREKQKQLKEEKKEKRKTVKGERRR